LNRPEAVILIRLAADLFVFAFGILYSPFLCALALHRRYAAEGGRKKDSAF
jgi:hypothetical protein